MKKKLAAALEEGIRKMKRVRADMEHISQRKSPLWNIARGNDPKLGYNPDELDKPVLCSAVWAPDPRAVCSRRHGHPGSHFSKVCDGTKRVYSIHWPDREAKP